MKWMKKLNGLLLAACMFLGLSPMMTSPILAEEGKADSYVDKVVKDSTFAFVDSRYYDGTNSVKVFNVGIFTGAPGEYYSNGDWTDMSRVYRREDYYKTDEFKAFSEYGKVGDPKPAGYPTNDVGGDADGFLPSYNAGTYTKVDWTGFSMFGRSCNLNYNYAGIIDKKGVQTYIEIWKVDPVFTVSTDKEILLPGESFTITMTIDNHFNNMEGLPKVDEVFFTVDHATATSSISKEENIYRQTFHVDNGFDKETVQVKAGILDTATNYKQSEQTLELSYQVPYRVTYDFISQDPKQALPQEVKNLLPVDGKQYTKGDTVSLIAPAKTIVKMKDGQWEFIGYQDVEKEFVIQEDTTIVGTWSWHANTNSITPSSHAKKDTPQTSVDEHKGFFISVCTMSIIGFLVLMVLHKKRNLISKS